MHEAIGRGRVGASRGGSGRPSFIEAVGRCLAGYVTFAGRAPRREYWYFVLFLLVGNLAAWLIDRTVFGADLAGTTSDGRAYASSGRMSAFFSLATILPLLAAGWRRMHDTGKSGLYLLYPLIVMVGILTFMGALAGFAPVLAGDLGAVIHGGSVLVLASAFLVFLLSPLIVLWWLTRPSQDGTNDYGPNPHEVSP